MTLPPIAMKTKTKERDFRKPPKIEVAMNKRTLYKPYTMMNGIHLEELKHIEHTELADKTRYRNKMEIDRCWKVVNMSYKDHTYAICGIRQEQSLVYQLMCRVQKDKRRIQRHVHRRREAEFQKQLKWQKVKDMCRFVVFKFRENVQRKKEKRLLIKGASSSFQLKIRSSTGKRLPPLAPSPSPLPANQTQTVQNHHREKFSVVNNKIILGTVQEATTEDVETLNIKSKIKETVQLSSAKENDNPNIPLKCSNPMANDAHLLQDAKQTSSQLKEQHHDPKNNLQSGQNQHKAKVIQVRKNKSSAPLTRTIQGFDSLQNAQNATGVFTVPNTVREDDENQTSTSSVLVAADLKEQALSDEISKAKPKTEDVYSGRTRRRGTICPPDVLVVQNQESLTEIQNADTKDHRVHSQAQSKDTCHTANEQHKNERESVMNILKKRRKARAKKDLDDLNKEDFVKYERTKDGSLKAFPGKRELFLPPSTKDYYRRQKLLKQEKEAILLQKTRLAKFYENVIELRDREVVFEKQTEVIKSKDKELPDLEENVVQLSNSIFTVAQQPTLLEDEANRYVRVYNKDTGDSQGTGSTGRRMSSWKM